MKYIAFIMTIFGIYKTYQLKNKMLILILVLTFFSFSIVILKAGNYFTHHNYYIIPFIPVLAFFAGYGMSNINKKFACILLLLIGIEGIASQQHELHSYKKNNFLIDLENDVKRYSSKNDRIVINSINPAPMYFAHRKGWLANNESLSNSSYIKQLKSDGCKYVVIFKKSFGKDLLLDYTIVCENEYYRIYKI